MAAPPRSLLVQALNLEWRARPGGGRLLQLKVFGETCRWYVIYDVARTVRRSWRWLLAALLSFSMIWC